jgi:hypothetical protein
MPQLPFCQSPMTIILNLRISAISWREQIVYIRHMEDPKK